MEHKEQFEQIIDKGEEVLLTFKPNRKRFVAIPNVVMTIFLAISLIILIVVVAILLKSEPSDVVVPTFYTMLGVVILFGLMEIFFFIILHVRYKKTFYCLTNKRIIIRTGFIGVDFKTLDIKMVGAIDIRVGLLDKIIKPATGNIYFGSSASPIITGNNGVFSSSFTFEHIDDAYTTYKEIKEKIEDVKESK